jgi:hypothetical protein
MKPIKPKPSEKKRILSSFSKFTQVYRILDYLSDYPRSPVGELCAKCSVANVPDVALKHNPQLRKHGVAIACHPAPVSRLNKHYQPTDQFEWSIARLSEDELKLPTKGPSRPILKDPNFKKRKQMIVDMIEQGIFINTAIDRTREFGLTR